MYKRLSKSFDDLNLNIANDFEKVPGFLKDNSKSLEMDSQNIK